MKERQDARVERFLNELGIDWSESRGYLRNTTLGKSTECSYNLVMELVKVYYSSERNLLKVSGSLYQSPGRAIAMARIIKDIFMREARYEVETSPPGEYQI